jgi:hypothetical protein
VAAFRRGLCFVHTAGSAVEKLAEMRLEAEGQLRRLRETIDKGPGRGWLEGHLHVRPILKYMYGNRDGAHTLDDIVSRIQMQVVGIPSTVEAWIKTSESELAIALRPSLPYLSERDVEDAETEMRTLWITVDATRILKFARAIIGAAKRYSSDEIEREIRVKLCGGSALIFSLEDDEVVKVQYQGGEVVVHDSAFLIKKGDYSEIAVEDLQNFSAEPYDAILASSEMHGRCPFCNKLVTTDASISYGYGPECAKRYGLPWKSNTHQSVGFLGAAQAIDSDAEDTDSDRNEDGQSDELDQRLLDRIEGLNDDTDEDETDDPDDPAPLHGRP